MGGVIRSVLGRDFEEGDAQHTNDTFGRKESENPRTGTAIGESMRTKKPVKVRKKPKPKGIGFPRL